jgi:hypothetical protein
MESFFDYQNDKIERLEQINLDDLYEKKKAHDQSKLFTFNKILNRIHAKIKLTARQQLNQQFCWFVVPEIILGVAHYDRMGCVEYVIEHLTKTGSAYSTPIPTCSSSRGRRTFPPTFEPNLKRKRASKLTSAVTRSPTTGTKTAAMAATPETRFRAEATTPAPTSAEWTRI